MSKLSIDGGLNRDRWHLSQAPSGPGPGTVRVDSVAYTTEGGKQGDKHLLITVSLLDDLDTPVSEASVSIELLRDGSSVGSASGSTGTDGTVTFTLKNARSGLYETEVTDVAAAGLIWLGETPENSFDK